MTEHISSFKNHLTEPTIINMRFFTEFILNDMLRFFTSFRMTSEGFRITNEGFGITDEWFRVTVTEKFRKAIRLLWIESGNKRNKRYE